RSVQDVVEMIRDKDTDESTELTILRNNHEQSIDVELSSRQDVFAQGSRGQTMQQNWQRDGRQQQAFRQQPGLDQRSDIGQSRIGQQSNFGQQQDYRRSQRDYGQQFGQQQDQRWQQDSQRRDFGQQFGQQDQRRWQQDSQQRDFGQSQDQQQLQ